MKIDSNSWHYQLILFLGLGIPSNLCPYVRKLLVAILFMVALVSMACIGVLCLSYPLWQIFHTDGYIAVASFLAWFTLLCFIRKEYHPEWDKVLYRRKVKLKGVNRKKDGLVKAYIKAAHDKVCPRIEFKSAPKESNRAKN